VAWREIARGWIDRRPPEHPLALAAGARSVVTRNGSVLASYMLTSRLGTVDFVPQLARSTDLGETWHLEGPIWPDLVGRQSIHCSVSRSADGELFLYGAATPIDRPNEPYWSEATQGLKANELIWSSSRDDGRTWSEPSPIPMPVPGAAEAPGPMLVTRGGRWLAVYAPYATFDPSLHVDRGQILLVTSDDRGATWAGGTMLRFVEPDSGGAESWIVELSDGSLLGTSWHIDLQSGADHPNKYAISSDGGATWSATRSTRIDGQATALAALPDGRALFVYNQRRTPPIGVWLAMVRPTIDDFGIESNEPVWRAAVGSQVGGGPGHDEWRAYAFGEPSATLLPDGTVLVAYWCAQADGRGIGFVKLTTGGPS
jgi:BNR repeat protein